MMIRAKSSDERIRIMQASVRLEVLAVVAFLALGTMGFTSEAAGQESRTVRAIGLAAGSGPMAERKALANAERNALEQACGIYIDAETITSNYQTISDRILSRVRGYLLEVRPVRTWSEDGVTHCEIMATVSMQNLERDLQAALGHVIARAGNPRCMIVITEDDDPNDLKPPKLDGGCAHRLERIFSDNGFELVDKAILDDVARKDMDAALRRGDIERMAATAAKFGAELLVYGAAEANPLGSVPLGGADIYRWDMTLDVRIVQSDTARVIVSDTFPKRRFVYQDLARRCGKKGFTELADEVGKSILAAYLEKTRDIRAKQVFQVTFTGCESDPFRDTVMPALRRLDGVRQDGNGVLLRESSGTEMLTNIYWAYDLNALASAIAHLDLGRISIEESERSGSRIRFIVRGCS